MHIRVAREDVYIPEWAENKEQEIPLKVHFKYLTSEQEEKYSVFSPTYKGEDITSVKEIELEVKPNAVEIWDTCVIRIENLFDYETDKPITDPKEVRKIPGIYGLISEVAAHIKEGITEEEAKNSEQPS